MKIAKNISFFIVLSILIVLLSDYLETSFLFEYLRSNVIGLLLTLLAINTATLGLIASKIQDVAIKYPQINFSDTIKEMKISLLEQIILIVVSTLTLMLQDSDKVIFELKDYVFNTLLVAVLIYAINILWDTGKAVFVILEEIQHLNKNNSV